MIKINPPKKIDGQRQNEPGPEAGKLESPGYWNFKTHVLWCRKTLRDSTNHCSFLEQLEFNQAGFLVFSILREKMNQQKVIYETIH